MTDDYVNITFINCTNIENLNDNIIFIYSLLSIPSSILSISLISLRIYTKNKPSITNKKHWRNFCILLTQSDILLQDHQNGENQCFKFHFKFY